MTIKYTLLILLIFSSMFILAEEENNFVTETSKLDSIFLLCESGKKGSWTYKKGPFSLKDLLQDSINLQLTKKKKKIIKRGFDHAKRFNEESMLAGTSLIPTEYVDENFDFVAFEILPKKDGLKERSICKSTSQIGLSSFVDCKSYTEDIKFYIWKDETVYSGPNGSMSKEWKDVINRESLIYEDYYSSFNSHIGSSTTNNRYQCYLSELDEINKAAISYSKYIKPFQEEWLGHINDLSVKLKAIKEKNKI